MQRFAEAGRGGGKTVQRRKVEPVLAARPEDHAGKPHVADLADLPLHPGQFIVAVAEAAGTRAYHHEDRHRTVRGRVQQTQRGRKTAERQGRAEFDPVGTAPYGGRQPGDGVDADFEPNHGQASCRAIGDPSRPSA